MPTVRQQQHAPGSAQMPHRPSPGFRRDFGVAKRALDDYNAKRAVAAAAATPVPAERDAVDEVPPLSSTYDAATPDVELLEDIDEEGNPRAVIAEGARRGIRPPTGGR